MIKITLVVAMIAVLAGCGVKNDLVRPNGRADTKTERNPSLPPSQTGR